MLISFSVIPGMSLRVPQSQSEFCDVSVPRLSSWLSCNQCFKGSAPVSLSFPECSPRGTLSTLQMTVITTQGWKTLVPLLFILNFPLHFTRVQHQLTWPHGLHIVIHTRQVQHSAPAPYLLSLPYSGPNHFSSGPCQQLGLSSSCPHPPHRCLLGQLRAIAWFTQVEA